MIAPSQDEFYKQHMYSNYGDLSDAVNAMVADYTKRLDNRTANRACRLCRNHSML